MDNERYNFNQSKKQTVKKTKMQGIIAVLVLVFIIGVAVLAFIFGSETTSQTQLMALPTVTTHLVSQTGDTHIFNATITLELTNDITNINESDLYNTVFSVINSLSYEEIAAANGMELIRDGIRASMGNRFSEDELIGIWLTDVLDGRQLVPDRQPTNRRFTGFFRNIPD